jgi:hypothetical protein
LQENKASLHTTREIKMSSQTLYRWAATALVISGLALAVGMILHPEPPLSTSITSSQWMISHFLWWLGALAGMVGIAGLYLRQRKAVGELGFAGSNLSVLGLVLIASAMYFESFIVPPLASRAPELFQGYPAGGGWAMGFGTAPKRRLQGGNRMTLQWRYCWSGWVQGQCCLKTRPSQVKALEPTLLNLYRL